VEVSLDSQISLISNRKDKNTFLLTHKSTNIVLLGLKYRPKSRKGQMKKRDEVAGKKIEVIACNNSLI
jgi:hypothetical protein